MTEEQKETSEKERRVRAITKLYYSNPKVLEAMTKFSQDREVVPRYFEGFGRRPDKIQYPSDIMGLVNRGATSFHASEELWSEPLSLNLDMSQEETSKLRKSWDLLIDVDSKYLDLSKEATKLIAAFLESKGVKNYGIKFSGSKGFHVIIPGKAFPKEYGGCETKKMFPEWPRAIVGYIFAQITPEFRKRVGKMMSLSSLDKIKTRVCCTECGKIAKIGKIALLRCNVCGSEIEKLDAPIGRQLKCRNNLNDRCTGDLELIEERDYHYCESCADFTNEKFRLSSRKYPERFTEVRGEMAEEHADLDLVLVAPRHLFRMPYALHEKTSLASVVITKNQIDSFSPNDANPLKIKIVNYLPNSEEGEAKNLLASALDWKKENEKAEEGVHKKYESYEKIDIRGVTENMFPAPIKKLLLGLKDGKKRGLFILLAFLRSLNFPPDYINQKVREWNKLNEPPLKEGYVRNQIDWHLRQKKTILPPNYDNAGFYKDIGLLDGQPTAKNPISEVLRELRRNNRE